MDRFTAMKVFERVASLQNFSAAARELRMTVSMVSRLVAELENDLGVRLLNRTTRKMNLTEAGAVYLERARDLLSDLDELNAATRNLHQTPTGRLRVTCADWIAHSHVFALMPAFMKTYPDVVVDLDVSTRFVDLVQEGYDVALRIGQTTSSSLIARKVYQSKPIMCATPTYCDARGVPADVPDLAGHNCILYASDYRSGHWQLLRDGREFSAPVSGSYIVGTARGVVEAVRADIGIGLLPLHDIRVDLEAGRLIRLLPEYDLPEDNIYAVYTHRQHLSAKVRAFVDFVTDALSMARSA